MHKNYIALLLLLIAWAPLKAQTALFTRQNSILRPITSHKTDNDMGPEIIDGILYFSSLRTENQVDDKDLFFDIYTLPVNETQDKDARRQVVKTLCSEFHDGPISYCEATGELFVTRSDYDNAFFTSKQKKHKQVPLKMVIYQQGPEGWQYKEEFPFNNPPYSVGQPAVNYYGDTLIFVSNQPGGLGQSDLYITIRKNGEWQKPQNMGPKVNTKKREINPFINTDGTLYFSSNGLRGKGKFDIYRVNLNKETRPDNMDRPINSGGNDYGFCLHPNQQIAYFVSNRKRGRDNDAIYCIYKNDFTCKATPVDSQLIASIDQKMANIRKQIHQYVEEMRSMNAVYIPIEFNVNYEITDKASLPDLRVNFWYNITNDTIKFGKNTYNLGRYLTEDSYPVNVMLSIIKTSLEGELKSYLVPGKQVEFNVNGEPDAIASGMTPVYSGEFGTNIAGVCTADQQKKFITINDGSELGDRELAFIRTYGMIEYLKKEINPLKETSNAFHCQMTPKNQLTTNHQWAKVEITIHNAFCNF